MGNRRASEAPVSIVSVVFASGFGEISNEAESGSLAFVGGASDEGGGSLTGDCPVKFAGCFSGEVI